MRFLLFLLGFAFLTAAGFSKDGAGELFAWYDRLGFEDLSKAKFARIWLGKWAEHGEANQLEQDIMLGFVLEDNEATFRVILGDLTGALLKRHGKDPKDRGFCGYQEISLKEEGERLLKALKNPRHFGEEQQKEGESSFAYYNRLPAPGRAFVIARECSRRGFKDLGNRLVVALSRHPRNDTLGGYPLSELLENQLSYVMLWRGWIGYRDPECSWRDLQKKFQRIVDECPRSYWKDRAEKDLKAITTLLDAEKVRKQLDPESPEELVWRLHEEIAERLATQAEVSDYWGRPYPFRPRQSVGVIAALRAKGNAAVPALLAELHRPPRPSRSASRFVRHGGSISVDDTGELAISILEEIAGFTFSSLIPEYSKEAEIALADDWWMAVQQGEERAWLQRHAQAGERQAKAVETAMMARHPANAFEAAAGAIRLFSREPDRLERHLNELLALKDRRTEAFLLKEFTNTVGMLEAELAFAYALRRVGSNEAEDRVLNAFREYEHRDFEQAAEALRRASPEGTGLSQLSALRFLLGSRSEATWRAIMEKWPEMPPTVQAEVIAQLGLRLGCEALR